MGAVLDQCLNQVSALSPSVGLINFLVASEQPLDLRPISVLFWISIAISGPASDHGICCAMERNKPSTSQQTRDI